MDAFFAKIEEFLQKLYDIIAGVFKIFEKKEEEEATE